MIFNSILYENSLLISQIRHFMMVIILLFPILCNLKTTVLVLPSTFVQSVSYRLQNSWLLVCCKCVFKISNSVLLNVNQLSKCKSKIIHEFCFGSCLLKSCRQVSMLLNSTFQVQITEFCSGSCLLKSCRQEPIPHNLDH